jgi:hypothetical protein
MELEPDRLRMAADDNAVRLAAVLVVVGLIGGYLTYSALASPGTQAETRQVSSWESTGTFDHRATVTDGAELFSEGTVLRNRSVYFRQVSPRLNGTFAYSYTASDSGNLTANTSVAVVLRSIGESYDGNRTVYWHSERQIGSATRHLRSGERGQVGFSVNVSALRQRAGVIERRVGDTPGSPTVGVVARVNLSGSLNGRAVDRTRTYRLPVRFEQGVYRVQSAGRQRHTGGRTRTVAVPADPSPVERLGGPALLIVSGFGLAGLLVGRRTGRLDVGEAERDRIAYRTAREEFDDWITRGRLSADAVADPQVRVDSLSGLVDTAIDTGERVIEDTGGDRLVVVSDGVTYVYDPPARSEGRPEAAAAEERPEAGQVAAGGQPGRARNGDGHA